MSYHEKARSTVPKYVTRGDRHTSRANPTGNDPRPSWACFNLPGVKTWSGRHEPRTTSPFLPPSTPQFVVPHHLESPTSVHLRFSRTSPYGRASIPSSLINLSLLFTGLPVSYVVTTHPNWHHCTSIAHTRTRNNMNCNSIQIPVLSHLN